jgi:hypothetical protein
MSRAKAKEQLSFVKPDFTDRQGQFLAFIYQYRILNKRAPAEADFMQFFQLTPPSVHSMILTLERRGFISRVPGQPRSITLLISPGSLPPLGTGQKPSVPQPEKTDQKPGGWITLRQKLATLEKPALIALLHNLFELAGTPGGRLTRRWKSTAAKSWRNSFPPGVKAGSKWARRTGPSAITVRPPVTWPVRRSCS